MWKNFLVAALIPVALLTACGGGGGGAGSCSAMPTPLVNTSECWEYSTDESNAAGHCAAAGGTYSSLSCNETNKVATCTTTNPGGSLTGSLFTVYWFSGTCSADFTSSCSGTLTCP